MSRLLRCELSVAEGVMVRVPLAWCVGSGRRGTEFDSVCACSCIALQLLGVITLEDT
jgi:hypothetical protein